MQDFWRELCEGLLVLTAVGTVVAIGVGLGYYLGSH